MPQELADFTQLSVSDVAAIQLAITLGAQGAFFHLFTHMLMKGLAFLSVGALMYVVEGPPHGLESRRNAAALRAGAARKGRASAVMPRWRSTR